MDPQMFSKTKRLSKDTGYVRPKKTYQDSMSSDDIKEKLKEYKKVSDIRKVIIGTHMRYFTKDKNTKANVFRLGGFLTKFGDEYKYIVLSNGSISWSVQNDSSNEFWAKMNSKEILQTAETEVEDKSKEQERVIEKYKKLKEKTDYMSSLLEEQQKENAKLAKKLKEIESVAKKNKK
jgi:hypothetical protein